jgi:hypothetical protein
MSDAQHAANKGGYIQYVFNEACATNWARALTRVIAQAQEVHLGAEGAVEGQIVQANRTNPNLALIDRQVQNPGVHGRLDLLALAPRAGVDVVVALEIKNLLDTRIGTVGRQVAEYADNLTNEHGGLRGNLARSYRAVLEQMSELGLSAPHPDRIAENMPVVAAVVLANYNPKSTLLGRAQNAPCSRPVHWHCVLDCSAPLSNPTNWPVFGQLISPS